MQNSEPVKMRNIYFAVSETEFARLHQRRQQTTCRSLAEFVRKLVCQQPVTVNHRDASLEELVTELSLLRRYLADSAAALCLSAEKVGAAQGDAQLQAWLERHQKDRLAVVEQIDQIYFYTKKAALKWLQ